MKLMKLLNLKIVLFMFMIGLLVTGSMSTYTVMADSHDEDEDQDDDQDTDDDDYENDDREVSIETSETEVSIESESETSGREDEFSAEISTDDDAEIAVEYSTENDTTEAEAEMTVEFFEILEFIDTNSDGVYNESIDTVVQTYDMASVGYKPIEYTTRDHTEGTEHIITLETNDGVFKVVVHIVGAMTNINGTDLKPTSLKIDILITNFDYQEADSKLALYSEVESTSEVEKDDDADDQVESDEEAFAQQGEGIFAFYSWKQTAEIDGTATDVLSSYEEKSETEQKLYLNYEHGQEIVHDPKLGISIAAGTFGDSSTDNIFGLWPNISSVTLFAISFIAVVIALAIPVIKYRKN